jgi:predicted enzyme related to lactoylglutathione lyase
MPYTPPPVGTIGWIDITTPDAARLRDFYCGVVGWTPTTVPMKTHEDYCMHPSPTSDPVAGICNAKGPNQDLPTGWIVYITVADLESSLAQVIALGGALVRPTVHAGGMGSFAVIRDPAGNHCALFQAAGNQVTAHSNSCT